MTFVELSQVMIHWKPDLDCLAGDCCQEKEECDCSGINHTGGDVVFEAWGRP